MKWNPRRLRHLWLWRSAGHALILLSLAAALLPAPRGIGSVVLGDKLLHGAAFAFLMLWYAQIYAGWHDRRRCALNLIGFGLLIEALQGLLPYRSADFWDLIADIGGVGIGFALAWTRLGQLLSGLEVRPAS